VLLPAAQRVAPGGRAVGIDIAPGMVEHTSKALEALHLNNAEIRLMDAAHLELESAQFTHALSSFSVFFFVDLPRVLGQLRRVLRPGGTIGFAFSRGNDPRWNWYEELLREVGAFDGLPAPIGYPRVRHPGVLVALLHEMGFRDAHEREEPTDFSYASPEAWWASLWVHGSRRPLERMAPDLLARVQREALERVRKMVVSDGVPERMQLVYVLARRPE
jgi:O-methyltransferase/aklanonic acid methyltransferase